jgi:hypothetical protein
MVRDDRVAARGCLAGSRRTCTLPAKRTKRTLYSPGQTHGRGTQSWIRAAHPTSKSTDHSWDTEIKMYAGVIGSAVHTASRRGLAIAVVHARFNWGRKGSAVIVFRTTRGGRRCPMTRPTRPGHGVPLLTLVTARLGSPRPLKVAMDWTAFFTSPWSLDAQGRALREKSLSLGLRSRTIPAPSFRCSPADFPRTCGAGC